MHAPSRLPLIWMTGIYVNPEHVRQTPGEDGLWDGLQFTFKRPARPDGIVVANFPKDALLVRCPRSRLWNVHQEPGSSDFHRYNRGLRSFGTIIATDARVSGPGVVHNQPGVMWHVKKTYRELHASPVPPKEKDLSWITSNQTFFPGHVERMAFLESIRGKLDFSLWGRGFTTIADKWDGLAPFRYSLAVENHREDHYWTEKIADPILAWTVPFYYGAPNIGDYLPAGSYIPIDIHDPSTPDRIRHIMATDDREARLPALAEARRLILEKYQLFPTLAEFIHRELERPARGFPLSYIPAQHAEKGIEKKLLRCARMVRGLILPSRG